MLGWLKGRFGWETDPAPEHTLATEAAQHALRLDPNGILALSARSAIAHYTCDYGLSVRLGRQALELNPCDPELLAELGWRLSIRGNFAEGAPLLERAISRTTDAPA